MSRGRIAIVAVVLVAFVVVVGVLVFANQPHGGQHVTITLKVTGAKSMTPDNPSAHQNDIVTINVKSDTNGEVHLHGYDIAFDTVAGQTVSDTFTADKTGSFDIEWEATSAHLGTFTVTP